MRQNLDNALILIRVIGIGVFVVGLFGVLYASLLFIAQLFVVGSTESWLWKEFSDVVVGGPYWVLMGGTILGLSRRLAKWAVKHCSGDVL